MGGRRWTRLGWIGWGWAERRCNSRSNQRRVRLVLPSTPEKNARWPHTSEHLQMSTVNRLGMGGTNWKTYDNRNGHLFMNSFRIDSNHWTWQAWVRLAKKYRWQDVKKLYEDFPKNAKTGGCWCDQQGPWSPCLAPPNFGHSLAGMVAPSLPNRMGVFLYM